MSNLPIDQIDLCAPSPTSSELIDLLCKAKAKILRDVRDVVGFWVRPTGELVPVTAKEYYLGPDDEDDPDEDEERIAAIWRAEDLKRDLKAENVSAKRE